MLRDSARSSESEQRALRELRHLASVFHPSVVQFKDHGWHDGRLWFVMPWYEGETLEERITRAPLTRREARPIFEKLAHALGAMHAAGIRHQDIKPENVILTRIDGAEGEDELGRPDTDGLLPVLIDFGVAAREAEMVVAGTPIYFAPEVAAQFTEGEATSAVTLKADVFSLALCLRNALEPEAQEEILEGQVDDFIQRRAKGERALPQQRSLRYLNGSFQRWLSTAEEERPTAREFATELRVLTEPEEQRARRRATLRWLAPLMLCIGSMAGTGAFALHHRAEIQKREALDLRENLMRSEARERTLKKDVRSLVDERHRSLQTRQQLASQLELKEEQLDTTRHDLHRRALESAQRRSELERARADLVEKQKELTSISAELASREGQLQDAQAALHTTENSLAQTLTRAQALETESRALREQSDKLTKQLTSAQDETSRLRRSRDDAARAKSRAEARVQSLQGALSDARITNQRLRERIQSLERARVAAQAALRGSSRALANEPPNNDFQW
ncbi:MAG: protein kinase, partial [Myxococcota bacterium]